MMFKALIPFLLCALIAPSIGWAQVGRTYVSVEAYVGLARAVHVGTIVELEQIEYEKPLTGNQELGKPYRLVFQVSETIRGEDIERIELVLALQGTQLLDYMRINSADIMLVAGPNWIGRPLNSEIGIEEQGERLENQRYQFRLLTPLEIPKAEGEDSIASQVNETYDSCRMFTNELEIVEGREMILEKARTFVKAQPEILSAVSIRVPNEFGALCGTPGAYSMITLPKCPSTEKTFTALRDDPNLVLERIEAQLEYEDFERTQMLNSIEKALSKKGD